MNILKIFNFKFGVDRYKIVRVRWVYTDLINLRWIFFVSFSLFPLQHLFMHTNFTNCTNTALHYTDVNLTQIQRMVLHAIQKSRIKSSPALLFIRKKYAFVYFL